MTDAPLPAGRPAAPEQTPAPGQAAARQSTRRFATPVEQARRGNAASLVPLTELFGRGTEDRDGEPAAPASSPSPQTPTQQHQAAGPGAAAAPMPHRPFPCGPCPFRRDAPRGAFTAEQYEAMRVTCRSGDGHAPASAPLFGCHPGEPGSDDDLACAGWLAVEGRNSIKVGLAIAFDRLPDTVLDPGPNWPPLYSSFEEMVAANHPDPPAGQASAEPAPDGAGPDTTPQART
ncbi:DUF6283 family protein [Nonomuraea spiralis]|uniref:DUF6283 family protein n=1 Tax=Nonomuraea spiralis TaxID=46182 RepID=UPI00379AAABF